MNANEEYKKCLTSMYNLRRFGIKLGLSTIRGILKGLGSPQSHYKTIHIAGTNGKGSIASTLSTILETAGHSVGLYTSPHLVLFNERFQINNQPVSDKEIMEAYKDIVNIRGGEREPTFFEFSTAMALHLFARRKVTWAVIETGMGGRLDATNVLSPELSIITNISLEHREYLGNTIAEIAGEKAGIIKAGTPLVTGVRQPAAVGVVLQKAQQEKAPVLMAQRDFRTRRRQDGSFSYYGRTRTWRNLRTNLAGRHQVMNASLVLAACESLINGGLHLTEDDIYTGLLTNHWPGRLEVIQQSPQIILDGAHNLAAARNLARYIKEELGHTRITLVIGVLDDKPYKAILKSLVPLCQKVILTRPKIDRGLDPDILAQACRNFSSQATTAPDVPKALRQAIHDASPQDTICVAGSLYVVGEARHFLSDRRKSQR